MPTLFFILSLCSTLFASLYQEGIQQKTQNQKPTTLVYSTRDQKFKILAGKNKVYHQIAIDQDMVVQNELTTWNAEKSSLIFNTTGYYEVSASFHFNPNSSILGYSRAGINFVICKNEKNILSIVASKRQTFYSENANEYNSIEIAPAIVHVKEGESLILCINAGLLERDMLSAKLGTSTKHQAPYSYQLKIEKL